MSLLLVFFCFISAVLSYPMRENNGGFSSYWLERTWDRFDNYELQNQPPREVIDEKNVASEIELLPTRPCNAQRAAELALIEQKLLADYVPSVCQPQNDSLYATRVCFFNMFGIYQCNCFDEQTGKLLQNSPSCSGNDPVEKKVDPNLNVWPSAASFIGPK